jgi:hypothetical protein
MINIKGLDKAAVLAALYNASKQQGMGFLHKRGASPMSVEEAREEINNIPQHGFSNCGELYFDYLHGRVMKVDISGDELNPWGYDRDNGPGAAQAAISTLL